MSNFHQLHNSLIDMDAVRLLHPTVQGVEVLYHSGKSDFIECDEPEKAIRELQERLNGVRSGYDAAVKKVVDTALNWDVLFKSRQQTIPEDDDLHFAVQHLLAIEEFQMKHS